MVFESVAGVGGGAVVHITIGFFNFYSKEAIAISTSLVFYTALIRFIFFSAWTKHPEAKLRTEIDYNTARMVFPIFVFGSYLGVILYFSVGSLA